MPPYAPTIPHQTYMIFQMMFAVITPALITGAFAERAKFSTFLVFMLLWATLVYDPVAHWVWGAGGWLGTVPEANGQVGLKALDFAGGTVVHINAGIAALVAAIALRQAPRLRPRADGAARHHDGGHRRCHPLVRLVRLQRRQRRRSRWLAHRNAFVGHAPRDCCSRAVSGPL